MTDNENPTPQKAPRHRSPNYPGISLKSAAEKVGAWYKADGLVASQTEAAMKHMKGDYGRVLSALKSYGLVNEDNGRIKLSQRGIDIVARTADDPKRKQALRDAALSPPIYRELWKEYSVGLPSDTTLQAELVAGRKFNAKFVGDFISDLRSTLEFAGISTSTVVESGQTDENLNEDPVEGSFTGLPAKESTIEAQTPPMNLPPGSNMPHEQQRAQFLKPLTPGVRQDVFSLGEGTVTIQWPATLSPESFEDVSAWLDILKRKIGRSVKGE